MSSTSTDGPSFEPVLEVFLSLRYPPRSHLELFQEVECRLLDLDYQVAGYATQVRDGAMKCAQISNLGTISSNVDSLHRAIDGIMMNENGNPELVCTHREYADAMRAVVHAMKELADRGL